MTSEYQRCVPLEVRRLEGERVRAKHPDKIPIIVERAPRSRAPELDKKKYLVPADLTGVKPEAVMLYNPIPTIVKELLYELLWPAVLPDQTASMHKARRSSLLFVKNCLPPSSYPLSVVYEEHHEDDLFLYMTYSNESVYGA